MKRRLMLLMLLLPMAIMAADVNLTPKAKNMTVGSGSLTLPANFVVSYGQLADSLVSEAARFVSAINATTGLNASAQSSTTGLIRMEVDETCAAEGYSLTVTTEGATLKARTATGFYYGFQTIKKILPSNVMAGTYNATTTYTLPAVTIVDEPRFGYRGFMLDVSRHFFPVEEIKRIIDLMSIYKMNVFHWHLTDDQGWRAEIKKYPKLTTVGSIAANCRLNDMENGTYWTNAQYGPLFYTQDEMREVVQYASERHVNILPEVDMPGHFTAAMASYPEFSCTPNGSHAVQTYQGGIWSDVLNVANTKAVQFAEDILDELMDIFPYPYIHIGGDECPTSAWESNSECQAKYQKMGLTSYRQLQSLFIKELSDHVQEKGRKLFMWNESVTASGADLDLMKETGATVMCWNPCQSGALKAAELGLPAIITEYHSSTGGYYINRKQSTSDSYAGAGSGDDTVEGCYNYVPVPTSVSASLTPFYQGVQGTFWTEWVSERRYLEYLALPRLMAVAEAGWTPQSGKDFTDFKERMAQDTTMLNLAGYEYAKHIWAADAKVMPKEGEWYRIQTTATDIRQGTCIELLAANSPLIDTYSNKNAAVNRLWNNAADDSNDYQKWTLEQSANDPNLYALVCKAEPNGSVNPTPTAQSNTGRWNYDTAKKNYSFVLGDGDYGETSSGNHYYTIRATQLSGWYMNSSMSGQGYAVNLWTNAADGNGGLWEFVPFEVGEGDITSFDQELYDSLPKLQERDTLLISCSVPGYENIYLSDQSGNSYLTWANEDANNIQWIAYKVTEMDSTFAQTAILRNTVSKRYIYNPASSSTGYLGYPIACSAGYSNAPQVTIQYQPETGDYQLWVGGKNLYPISLTSPTLPGIVSSGNTVNNTGYAVRPQGAGWTWTLKQRTDGVTSVSSATREQGIYDLSGRKLKRITRPGIYVVDGKQKLVR